MPTDIRNIGPTSLPPDIPETTSSQSSGPAAPSPQDLQAKIDQGIQEAVKDLELLLKATGGQASGNAKKADDDDSNQEGVKHKHHHHAQQSTGSDTTNLVPK